MMFWGCKKWKCSIARASKLGVFLHVYYAMNLIQQIRMKPSHWQLIKKKNPKHLCSVCVLKVNCLGILVGLRMLKLRIHRAQRWKGKWYNQDPVFLICNSSWWAYVGNQLWLKASRIRLYLPCSLGPSRPVLLTAKPHLPLVTSVNPE